MERKQLDSIFLSKGELYEVYLINELEKKVLKQISFDFLKDNRLKDDENKVERVFLQFKKEQNILKKLNDSKIKNVPVYVEGGKDFFLTLFIPGESLSKNIKYKTIGSLYRVILKIGEILRNIHEIGVVHCDIKPENIIIKNGVLSIIDFGSSLYLGEKGDLIQGSKGYSAPEIYNLNKIKNESTDVYSYCKLIKYLLEENNVKIPEGLHELIRKGSENSQEERYKTIKDFIKAWKKYKIKEIKNKK